VAFLTDLTPIDWLGIVGALIIVIAYFGVSTGLVKASGAVFHLVNLLGAGLILLSLYFLPNPAAIAMEVMWSLIAIGALAQIYFRKR